MTNKGRPPEDLCIFVLASLHAGFTTDLHNFAFLGKNPRLGCASDWVWFNVPHGPLKQIDSFVAAVKACKNGKEEVCCYSKLALK